MIKRLVMLLLLAPNLALADKVYEDATGGSYDCGEDPVVNIETGGGTYTFTGACKQVNINGASVKLTVADVAELNINGASNAITATELGAVNINGAKNKVTWKKAKTGKKPAVATNGKGNSVARKK